MGTGRVRVRVGVGVRNWSGCGQTDSQKSVDLREPRSQSKSSIAEAASQREPKGRARAEPEPEPEPPNRGVTAASPNRERAGANKARKGFHTLAPPSLPSLPSPPSAHTLDLPVCSTRALALAATRCHYSLLLAFGHLALAGPPPPLVAPLCPLGPCAQRPLAGLCLHADAVALSPFHPSFHPPILPQAQRPQVPPLPPSAHLTSSPSSLLIPVISTSPQSFPPRPSSSLLIPAHPSSSQLVPAHPSTSHNFPRSHTLYIVRPVATQPTLPQCSLALIHLVVHTNPSTTHHHHHHHHHPSPHITTHSHLSHLTPLPPLSRPSHLFMYVHPRPSYHSS
jgi:hypothetical protein